MKCIIIIAIVAAIAIAGCGTTTTTVTSKPPATTTVPAVDRNQQLADQMAKLSPSDLQAVCDYARLAPGAAEKMAEHILGPQIIRLGGTPSEVAVDLLAKC